MRLLIAEDNPMSCRMLEASLKKWGHEVVAAHDGNEAWQCLQADDAPVLAILDWEMPGIDGIDLCEMVRKLDRTVRPYLILLTARTDKEDLVAGLDAGADDYVSKPFDPDELRARVNAAERILELQLKLLRAEETLRHQANHDALTGLLNRGAIVDQLRREFDRTCRNNEPVAVVMIDLDHFKKVNDTYGHPAGDEVLIELAKRMSDQMRSYEYVGRYGGEEFLAVLAGCDLAGAIQQAERLRHAVADEPFKLPGTLLPITASLGVASSCELRHPSEELLLQLADTALYRAKDSGRNCVREASDLCDSFTELMRGKSQAEND